MKLPIRHEAHTLETISEDYFVSKLPKGWTRDKPANDYGIDLRVGIFENRQATGLEFIVQLKSSQKATKGDHEKVKLKVRTYNYLRRNLSVVMLIKYIEEIDEAYWILLKDIPQPDQDNNLFTIYIPKTHTLSTISWKEIKDHIYTVTDDKLKSRILSEQLEQLKGKLNEAQEQLSEFQCPHCCAPLIGSVGAPVNAEENHWDIRQEFECGFQRCGATIESLCPSDPRFPKLEDYELNYEQTSDASDAWWTFQPIPKTVMAKKQHFSWSHGMTKEEAKQAFIDKYTRYIERRR